MGRRREVPVSMESYEKQLSSHRGSFVRQLQIKRERRELASLHNMAPQCSGAEKIGCGGERELIISRDGPV